MDRFERIYGLDRVFRAHRRPVSLKTIREKLNCSEPTARRVINDLKNYLNAPITYDRKRNGYYYLQDGGQPYELPGMWFNAEELYALLVSHHLLSELQPGFLTPYIDPLRERIDNLLEHQRAGHPEIGARIRILQMAARPSSISCFRQVATAVLERRRLQMWYHGRERDETTERIISPQRLVYYRSNWYTDAWCHLRNGIRTFSLDRLEPRVLLQAPAREIADATLDRHFQDTYGIYAGKADQLAVLQFSPTAAKWVADEQWHPDQKGQVLKDGGYQLEIPYGDPRELIGDILRFGPDVKVLKPLKLQKMVRERLRAAGDQYQ